jgi:hypothetical protein
MADWHMLFPSKYLSPADFGGKDTTVQIATIRLGVIEGTEEVDGQTVEVKKQKGIMTFDGVAKEYVLTKAVGHALSMMFGDDASAWKGHKFTFCALAEKWFGSMEPRLRVRGSPEMTAPISKTIKLGRKKYQIDLVPTGPKAAK